jgi:hypothetical protein
LTSFKAALELIRLFGFQESKDEATKEIVFKMNSSVSVSFLKVSELGHNTDKGKKVRF